MKLKVLTALANGPLRTGDLDEAVIGYISFHGVFPGFPMAPYGHGLAELIAVHRVVWWIADNADVWYALRPKSWNIIGWWRLRAWLYTTGGELHYEP